MLKVFYQGGFQGKRAALKRETGRTQPAPFWGGGQLEQTLAKPAAREGPRPRTIGVPLPSPNLPPFSPSPSWLAIDRVCDMVDQYGRDIKPAGCLPASASLSLPCLPCFPFPEPHPDPPLPWTPYPRLWRARAPTRCQPPYSGRGEPGQPGEGGEYGVGRGSRWGRGSHW